MLHEQPQTAALRGRFSWAAGLRDERASVL